MNIFRITARATAAHNLLTTGETYVWVRVWMTSSPRCLNFLPQALQSNFFTRIVRKCVTSAFFEKNFLSAQRELEKIYIAIAMQFIVNDRRYTYHNGDIGISFPDNRLSNAIVIRRMCRTVCRNANIGAISH